MKQRTLCHGGCHGEFHGVTTLEAALCLVMLSTLIITGFGVLNGVRENFRVSSVNAELLHTQSVKPLLLSTTPEGSVQTQVNVADLSALLATLSNAAAAALGASADEYYFEVAYAVAQIDPRTGVLVKLDQPQMAQTATSGMLSPSAKALSHTDLEKRFTAIFSADRDIKDADSGTSSAPLYAQLTGLRSPDGSTVNFVDRAVVIGSRLVKRIPDPFTQEIWKQISGSDDVYAVEAYVLRGEFR